MTLIDTFRKDVKSALSKGAFHLFVSMVFSQGIALLLGIVLARLLGPENLGHVRVIQAVLQFAGAPAAFGMASAIAKYVSEFQLEELKKKVLSQGMFFNLFTALFVSFIVFLLSQSAGVVKDSVARYYLQFICWTLPFTVATSNVLCDFQGRKQIKEMAATNIFLNSFSFLTFCSLTYFWMLKGYALATIGYGVITGLALLWLIKRNIALGWDGKLFRKMFRFGGFGMLAIIFWTPVRTIDTLCISNILNDAALVGYYGVASIISRGLMIIPGAITQTAFPYLSERSADFSEIWRQLWRVGKRVALIMGFACVMTVVLAHWIVTLLFGKEYTPSVSVLQVLIPGIFVYSLMNVSGNTYVALGRTDVSLYITLVAGIFNVVMNILLIKHLGMIGAAWATVFTYIVTLTIESFWWWNFYNRGRKYS
jgi:O-antigen/teichoic acid export membrane protein